MSLRKNSYQAEVLSNKCEALTKERDELRADLEQISKLVSRYRSCETNYDKWYEFLWTDEGRARWEPPVSIVNQICSLLCLHTKDMVETHEKLAALEKTNAELRDKINFMACFLELNRSFIGGTVFFDRFTQLLQEAAKLETK